MNFFTPLDIIFFPFCVLVLFFIIRSRANRHKDREIRSLYYRAFYFKLICVLAFTLVTAFYFEGGDTTLYYYGAQDLRAAISADFDNLWAAIFAPKLTSSSPLFPYFYYDNNPYDITYNYMISSHNFFPSKLALFPSYIFGNSYLCINTCFGFFALAGAIRLYRAFLYFYPTLNRQLGTAILFLPGVAFWSSGLLKDPITFGCIGFILHALVNIFFRKKNYLGSAIAILVFGYLLMSIKVYILLVLVLGILIWVFAELNKLIKERTLRGVFTVVTLSSGIIVGYFLLDYITSFEAAQQFQLETLLENVEREREGFAAVAERTQGDSHFTITSTNPVLMMLEGFVATFYRPFPWEINTPIALLSAAESAVFLLITLFFLFKKGIIRFFSVIFSDGRITMSFVFATVFAIAVGTSTANFGALSRYKIPCTPFYLVMMILVYYKSGLPLPRWFNKIVDFTVPKTKTNYVRYRRIHTPAS